MTKQTEKLSEDLAYLKLVGIKENFIDSANKAAKKKISHLDFLIDLIEGEVARRKGNARERRLRNAKLPYPKSLEQFRWSHPEKINRQQIENLFHLNFIDRKENVVFVGGCGLGKSHLSIALATEACTKGYTVLFAAAVEIINALSAAKAMNNLQKALLKYTKPHLLVIDELHNS